MIIIITGGRTRFDPDRHDSVIHSGTDSSVEYLDTALVVSISVEFQFVCAMAHTKTYETHQFSFHRFSSVPSSAQMGAVGEIRRGFARASGGLNDIDTY